METVWTSTCDFIYCEEVFHFISSSFCITNESTEDDGGVKMDLINSLL